MQVRGHTLVWTHQNPSWLVQGTFLEKELRRILREHILKVVGHYRGRIFAWDVINEAADETGALRGSLWYDQPGIGLSAKNTAYIEQAFRWAHEADPKALLFYNDAGAEAMNTKSDALFTMLTEFRRRKVPIDGIGLQMHLDLSADVSSIAENIHRFCDAGLLVHITEADLGIPVDNVRRPLNTADLERQAEILQGVLSACLAQRGCTVFQTWGFTDKYSWINSSSHGTRGAGLLFDAQFHPKPAYTAILNTLRNDLDGPTR
jgi:endo-1,4-beta-xylanase